MFAPELYKVRKIPAYEIFNNDFNLAIKDDEFIVLQQDCMMFRQIRNITGKNQKFVKQIIFIDCNGSKGKKENIRKLVINGFVVNGKRFYISERSASMTRNAILGFISEDIKDSIEKVIDMDLKMDKTVLSKWCAYRGLMFSSCHCLEGWFPNVIVVDDYETIIKNQKLKWLSKEERPFTDKNGNDRIWKTHGIEEGIKDLTISAFDGHGLIHPDLVDEIQKMIGMAERPTTMMLRAPFIKGLVSQVDYTAYYKDAGVDFIQDVWGRWHSVEDRMIILTKSMYKGYKYFKDKGTYSDWDNYWSKIHKYNHCWGVAKWNFSKEQEPEYVRGNYQILQDLNLDFKDFSKLSEKSLELFENVVNGNELYTYCFLGLNNDNPEPLNNYAKAIMKNPEMIKEQSVRRFLIKQTNKYIDKIKCGKFYLHACYKFIIPDIIMMLEWIGGNKNPEGSLEFDEFWSCGYQNNKEYLIERNPHICKSEHLVLRNKKNEMIEKYCSHLVNTCMLNCKSLSPQRMNGADYDGDLVLLIDEPIMLNGVDKDCAIVLNLDEKMTALAEDVTKENIANLIERTMVSLIGEASNCATCYHNKPYKTQETKTRYEKNVDILSIVNSFAIDFAKTGFIMQIPFEVAKYSKPYPYFMRYVSDYYDNLYNSMEESKSSYRFQKSKSSNMNNLCKIVEKWHNKEIKWKRHDGFDYSIMMDDSIPIDMEKVEKINVVYKDFKKAVHNEFELNRKCHNYDRYKNELAAYTKDEADAYFLHFDDIYNKYKKICESICSNKKELANIAVYVCYVLDSKKNMNKFIWAITSEGILENIKQQDINIPIRCDKGRNEYLGKRYKMTPLRELRN